MSPSGAKYTMWESGDADNVNVIEQVIVPTASTMDEMGHRRWMGCGLFPSLRGSCYLTTDGELFPGDNRSDHGKPRDPGLSIL